MPKTIIAIGDCHFPFSNAASLFRIEQMAKQIKPQVILQIGDAMDAFSFGKYPRTHNLMTPNQELELGKKMLYQMWENLKKASPKSKMVQMTGNHDERVIKRLIEKAPELEFLYSIEQILDLPRGVEIIKSERDEFIIDDILFMHGFRSRLGDHAKHNGMNTVCGHSHLGGVVYQRLGKKTIWELNCGFIAKDQNCIPLGYTRQRISKWTQGVGLIDHLGPRFIPFENL